MSPWREDLSSKKPNQDMRLALTHPFGLTLRATSLLLALTLRYLPGLDRWSHLAGWLVPLGLLVYIASVIALRRTKPAEVIMPELQDLYSVRTFMEAKLSEDRVDQLTGRSELTRVLADAIDHLDRQVTPSLRQILERHRSLSDLLARYEIGTLPSPGPDVLERLHRIHDRQRAAVDESIQQASNAAATLVAILQEDDDTNIAIQLRDWVGGLMSLHDAIVDVLQTEDEQSEVGVMPDDSSERVILRQEDVCGSSEADVRKDERLANGNGFNELVQEALRRLNNPSALSECELVSRLPVTLTSCGSSGGNGVSAEPTPLEQAQVLRELLVSSIDLLKPPPNLAQAGIPEALQYHILHDEYVLRKPTRHIMIRHSVSESMFHRHRRAAVSAVARHLETQEDLIAQEQG